MKTKFLAALCTSLLAVTALADGETSEDVVNACGPIPELSLSSKVCMDNYTKTFGEELTAGIASGYIPHLPSIEFMYLSHAARTGSALEDETMTRVFGKLYFSPEPLSAEDTLHGASQQFRQSIKAKVAASCPNVSSGNVSDASLGNLIQMALTEGRLCNNPSSSVDDYPSMLKAVESTIAAMSDTDREDLCANATATNFIAIAIRQCQERTTVGPHVHDGSLPEENLPKQTPAAGPGTAIGT
jgi:hypothetical protein